MSQATKAVSSGTIKTPETGQTPQTRQPRTRSPGSAKRQTERSAGL